jgi:hypothetical protein
VMADRAFEEFSTRLPPVSVAAACRSRPYRDVPHQRPARRGATTAHFQREEESWDSPLPMSTWDPPKRRGSDT